MVTITMIQLDEYLIDVLMRDLVAHDRKPAAFLVYLWLAGEQQRRGGEVQISYQELAENVGVSKSSAQASVRWLTRRRLLGVKKRNVTATPCYTTLTPWHKPSAAPPSRKVSRPRV